MPTRWDSRDIPDQTGRTIVVTGANSGLGLATSRMLTDAGARVLMACRDTGKGQKVAPAGAEVCELDLADLASVRTFAEKVPADRIDVLINNAGVMNVPKRTTADGFELQFGTNYLGHFALTGLLLPRITARVVTVSSAVHAIGRINFNDLQHERHYQPWLAYGQSKLANLLFTYELDRRARAAGRDLISVAAHPGYASTNLQTGRARMTGSALGVRIAELTNRIFGQSAKMGALPQTYAATAPDVHGGEYFGPGGLFHQHGYPERVRPSRAARNVDTAQRLWDVAEDLTGVSFEFSAAG
ncbi:MAG: SDR family NAD(P)-dependent oxidoreductase [Mycobacterium sp.]|nr:SDR family NAD(P)-dependent oxidoreductase [Mycobacterium sp.]